MPLKGSNVNERQKEILSRSYINSDSGAVLDINVIDDGIFFDSNGCFIPTHQLKDLIVSLQIILEVQKRSHNEA